MSVADLDRIQEARRRLREANDARVRIDGAVRICQLDSPRTGGEPLAIHSRFVVIAGLTETAKHAISATIDALYRGDPTIGLNGTVVIEGLRRPLHAPRSESEVQSAGAAAIFADHFAETGGNSIAWADAEELRAVTEALTTAIGLTNAELRGADEAARAVRTRNLDAPETIDLEEDGHESSEVAEALEALASIEPDAETTGRLEELLAHHRGLVAPTMAQSAVEQYGAALARLLPSDGSAVRAELESKLESARRAVAEHRRASDAVIDELAGQLDLLGIEASSGDVVATAERVLEERDELAEIRRRLEARLTEPQEPAVPPADARRLADIELRRDQLRRRLHSQQRLLAATREQLEFATRESTSWGQLPGGSMTPCNSEGRPLPILVEDPVDDLPSRHAAAALSVLLRVSELTQVICLSDQPDLRRWAHEIGSRVGWIRASGWFAGEPEAC